mgnify:FL=1
MERTCEEQRIIDWLAKQERDAIAFAYKTSFRRKLALLWDMRATAKRRGVRLWILAFHTLFGQKIIAACYGQTKASIERGEHKGTDNANN